MDTDAKNRIGSIFSNLIKKKNIEPLPIIQEEKDDNVKNPVQSIEELISFQSPIMNVEIIPEYRGEPMIVTTPVIQQTAKISLSLRGKTALPISYNFYKCNMVMEYSTGSAYNFDNDLVINPGRYEIGAKFLGDNVEIKMSFSDYLMDDGGKFYKTEKLTDFTVIEVTKKTRISFFAYPRIMGNSYDIKMIEVNLNLVD